MFAKIKSSNFIDALQFELSDHTDHFLKGILKDEQGSVCSIMEREIARGPQKIHWTGLNDLPYGKYTLELLHGKEAIQLNLVKRI